MIVLGEKQIWLEDREEEVESVLMLVEPLGYFKGLNIYGTGTFYI